MSLRDEMMQHLKEAMKSGEKRKVATIRMMQAALKDRDIEARGLGKEPLSDEDIFSLLQKMIKQRQESLVIYEGAGRQELADQEREEADIIGFFLPKQLNDEESRDAVQKAISDTGAMSLKDMGKVVAALKTHYAGRMDFAKASGLVKELLPKG